ncbi:MAG: hypothetical protein KY453_05140 [Gemmatimonadetes bacterium]|nr:hypothetical protein [Gemmatimonadota bacterium]
MSRAFVNEDAGLTPEPSYDLPDPGSKHYEEAAARALLQGADQGDSLGAERATGRRWGQSELVPHVRDLLEKARAEGDARMEQLAKRFLRAAGVKP